MIRVPKRTSRGTQGGFENPGSVGDPLAVSAVFGPRPFAAHIPTVGYDYDFHRGIDIASVAEGDPVYAPTGGSVVRRVYTHFHFVNADQVTDDLSATGTATWNGVGDLTLTGTLTIPTQLWYDSASEWILEVGGLAMNTAASTAEIAVTGAAEAVTLTYDHDLGEVQWTLPGEANGSAVVGSAPVWLRIHHTGSGSIDFQSSADGDTWTTHHTGASTLTSGQPMTATLEGSSIDCAQLNLHDDGASIDRFGNWITLSRTDGKIAIMHLSRVLMRMGDVVAPGQLIGLVGKTGFGTRSGRISTPHPHVEWSSESTTWAYSSDEARNPLAPTVLPREDVTNNVTVTAADVPDPDAEPSWMVSLTVARADSDFDLNEIEVVGTSGTRTINFNTRAGLNADRDIPVHDGVYLVPKAFNAVSAAYELDAYFHKAVVGSGDFTVEAKDTEGNQLFFDTFSFISFELFYGEAGGAGSTAGLRYGGGGGGGATAAGGAGSGAGGGDGGDGIAIPITGSSVTYGGGGGGGAYLGAEGDEGAGGAGGGGRGGWTAGINGTAGTDGLGGGGGGGGTGSGVGLGGNGGDGVVVLRYVDGAVTATGGTVTSYTEGATDYTVHTFDGDDDFVVSSAGDVDYLVVGAGGGGGGVGSSGWGAAGGGAGAVRLSLGDSPITAPVGTHRVVVGRGGQGGQSDHDGVAGGTSSVLGVIARGGGGGSRGKSVGGGGRGGCGGGGARGGVGGASVELVDGQYAIRQYFLEDATVVQNTVGATIGKHAITMPGGSAAANADDANALVLEWPAVDVLGNVIGQLEHPYDMVLGALRLLHTGARTALMSSDLLVSLELHFPLDALNVASEGGAIGCALSFADASSIAPTILTKDRGGTWASSVISGASLDSGADMMGAVLTWTGQPGLNTSRGARSQGFCITYAEYDRESWGRVIVSTNARRQQATVPVDMHNTPVIRLAVMRTSGSAGDLTFEPRMFSELMVVQ